MVNFKELQTWAGKIFDQNNQGRQKVLGDKDKWPVDRHNALDYFKENPELKKIVYNYLQELSDSGKETYHLDICGRAKFGSLVNRSFMYAYTKLDKKNILNEEYIEGDIMESTTTDNSFNKMISDLKEKKIMMDIVTFVPVGGLSEYEPQLLAIVNEVPKRDLENVLFKFLFEKFKLLISLVNIGGLIYLGESALLQPYYNSNLDVFLKIFKHLGLEIIQEDRGNNLEIRGFLLKRTK